MPVSFPAAELTDFMAAARAVLLTPTKSIGWSELAGASNLIGWRFRAANEYWQAYKSSWTNCGPNVDFEEIYERERNLYGMFSSGVSSIECTAYSIAALLSHPSVLGMAFGQAEQRACSPKKLAQWVSGQAATQSLKSALDSVVNAPEWKCWVDLRNRMTHRSNLPRVVQGAVGNAPPPAKAIHFAATSSTDDIEGELDDFDELHTWLADTVRLLLREGRAVAAGP